MAERTIIYTDGSCRPNPGKGGWAYIAVYDDIEIHGSGGEEQTTNNIMEMTAIIRALQDLNDEQNFTIYTDSMYVINCVNGTWKRKKNQLLWLEYDKVAKGKNIKFIWVKAHNNDYYNELVDKLAKSET